MKIAFYGDSLTEGTFGVSFLDSLKRKLPAHELINFGEGGDTVISLHHRLIQMESLEQADLSVLWIGVNDILGRMTLLYRIVNKIRKKPYTSSIEEFRHFYRAILEILLRCSKRIITLPPLFLGEDLENKWNTQLGELSGEIQTLSDEVGKVKFAQLRDIFKGKMGERQGESYLPTSLIQFTRDKATCFSVDDFDRRSSERGLYFTMDGVHLNSTGAEMVADFLKETIERILLIEFR